MYSWREIGEKEDSQKEVKVLVSKKYTPTWRLAREINHERCSRQKFNRPAHARNTNHDQREKNSF